MVRGLPSDENEDHITRNFEAYGTMGTLPCQVKKVCLAYRSSDYEEMEKKVNMQTQQMKKMQVEEMQQAIDKKIERIQQDQKEKDKAPKIDRSKIRPDPKDYSPEFQDKFKELQEQTMSVYIENDNR